jgi:hypothetical protein
MAVKRKRMTKKERSALASALGKLGASKGGKARAESLSARRRKEIARNAGLASQAAARARREREAGESAA